jgi:hypothetical protein
MGISAGDGIVGISGSPHRRMKPDPEINARIFHYLASGNTLIGKTDMFMFLAMTL